VRRAAAALGLAALVTSGAAAARAEPPKRASAATIERGQCVKRSRTQQRACLQAATARCREQFEAELIGCFPSDADCVRDCLAEQVSCRAAPKATEDGCKLACGSDLKVELVECRKKADVRGCEPPARVKALKCKQRCAAETAPKLQECIADFDDCVGACIRSAGR
jgi:hypothetical protein